MITGTLRSFCETSRAQDRVLLYFAGHAFEKDGKGYFAPLEGETSDAATVIPVADIYEMLKTCKATQRVVVWDVCRRNPARPRVRPDFGPMTEALARVLSASPPGIEVVLPCAPGEFALEYSEPKGEARLFAGSALHDALRQAFEDRAARKKPESDDPIPIAEMFPEFERYVASAAKAFGVKQTPKLIGKRPDKLINADSKEAPAAAAKIPLGADAALLSDLKEISAVLDLPPVLGDSEQRLPNYVNLFSRNALKSYEPDVPTAEFLKKPDTYRLRVAVLRALQSIRDTSATTVPTAGKRPTAVDAPITDKSKKLVLAAQEPVALALAKLEGELEYLASLGRLRDKEPKLWRAHYDYTMAELRLRLAVLNEYNLALGHIRTESLPELTVGSRGWQLVPVEKMQSKKPIRDLFALATEGFKSLAAENKGTPWEVLAKRGLLTMPGLRWEPMPK
jgi:hypothetical protein